MDTIDINGMLRLYAEWKKQEKEANKRIEELAPQIIEYMVAQDIEKQPTTLGTFSLVPKKTWKYTGAVDKAKKELEEIKADEEATGKATFTEKPYLLFKEPKD